MPVVHAWDDYYAEQSRLPMWLTWPIERWSVKGADLVTSVSHYNLHLAEKWGRPCRYIPHGVDGEQRPTTLRLDSSRMKVVYLGDQSPYKGVTDLVRAVDGVECDLYMVGTTNREVKAMSPANVHFTGPVPPEEVQAVLAQADVLVNPSDQDSNFKFAEYAKAGKAILGRRGRANWAFSDGEDALLVDDFREGLGRLIHDVDLRERIAANVQKREVLSWQAVAQRTMQVYCESLAIS